MQRSFIAELASIDEMPVSIDYFLDLSHHKIFDDTAFFHHDNTEHVIVAAPIDFETQRIKHTEMKALNKRSIGFPEYSTKYPHKKYTIGFAGQGPTFYINIIDNTEHHGPNGPSQHLLPGEAEPCFATIVEGFQAVDDMIEYGLYQYRSESDGEHPWASEEHAMTHLVTFAIVDNNP
jgi:cyclophilin family peptidyl-prolyl cis-trans isomerase